MRRQQRQQHHQLVRLNLHLQRRFNYYNSCSSVISSSSNIKSSSSSGRSNVTTTSPSPSQSQSQLLSSRSRSLSFSSWTNTTIQDAAHNVIVHTKNSNRNKSIMSSNNNITRIRSNYRYSSNNTNGTTSEMITVRSRKEEEEKEDDENDNDDDENEEIERETETILTVELERHSIEDTIISVHVSDKIFKTLKSTLQYSPILWETIVRSEQQQQNKSDIIDSIFIDRDPKHFPTILAYLRNEADGISYNSSNDVGRISNGGSACTASTIYKIKGKILASKDKSNNAYTKYVRLPSGGDATELEELFIEAKHYQLDDLQKQLSHCTLALQAISFLRGGGSGNNNPFNGLKEIIQNARNTTLMVVGTGTTIGGINWATSFSETKNTILMSLFGGG